MISLSRRVLPAAQILLLLLASAAALAADLNPAALAYKSPDQLKWRDPTGAAGINQAVLVVQPGLFRLAAGNKLVQARNVPIPPCQSVTHFLNALHSVGC